MIKMYHIKGFWRRAFLTSMLAAVPLSPYAQTAPNVSTTDISTAGYNTSNTLQNASPTIYMSNNGETLLVVKGGAAAVTATLKTQATSISQNGYGSTPLSDVNVSVPAGAVVVVGPFPTGRWNNQYGLLQVSMSSVVGISATGLSVPQ
jgi:hypothetical protein